MAIINFIKSNVCAKFQIEIILRYWYSLIESGEIDNHVTASWTADITTEKFKSIFSIYGTA